MAGIRSERRPASDRNTWPPSNRYGWPVPSESATTATPEQRSTADLCDETARLLDAIGAILLAVDGLNDEWQRRSMTFLVEKVQDIAEEVNEMARRLHAGGAS